MLSARVISLLLAAVLLGSSPAHGQQLTQYAHTAWRFEEGVFDASPISIAQTTDGFLWIGTLNGLIRFDGVHFESSNDRLHELRTCCALSVLGSSDGSLWIGTGVGLAKLSGGKLSAVTNGDGRYNHLIEDRRGRIWGSRSRIRDNQGPLCEVEGTRVHCHGQHDGLGCRNGDGLAQDNSGTVWVADEGKICSWNDGAAAMYAAPPFDTACKPGIESLFADADQSILIGCQGGLRRLEQGRFVPFQSALLDGDRLQGSKLLHDRRGGLWIGTKNDGLYHIANAIADHFGVADGLSDDNVSDLFEDHEGNIWVATPNGVDRFHRLSVLSFSSKQGFRGIGGSAVLASRDGHTIWTTGPQGLAAMRDGKVTLITQKEGLPGQQVTGLFEDHLGALWMGIDQDLFSYSNGRFSKKVRTDGRPTGMVVGMAEDANQSLWIVTAAGTDRDRLLRLDRRTDAAEVVPKVQAPSHISSSSRGLVYLLSSPLGQISILHDGQAWENVSLPTGPRTGHRLLVDAEDSLFVATDAGLYRWRDRKWAGLTTKNGLPCAAVQDLVSDEDRGLWLHLTCGFVHIGQREVDAWSRDRTTRLNLTVYDALEGARPGRGNFEPSNARTANGQLWFATGSVLQMIDPRNLAHNDLAPPVHIEHVKADDKIYDATNGLRLPPRIRNLAIDYTALSFVAPEKVHFRYTLEGQSRDWQEVINDRRVQFTNLAPGPYRFRVVASNNSGVWNETGAALDFSIAPAYYQTRWFQAVSAVGTVALLWVAYQLRIQQVARQFNLTLDARVSERMRIARDLHDTLLQSFQGALLRFQAVSKVIKTRPDEASERLERALDQAEVAITEGRDAVQGLRASATTLNDLANGIASVGAELTSDPSAVDPPAFEVDIIGESRDLNPIVRDEAYRIAGEALRNAVKHAQARRITVTIHYEPRQLRVTVHDDGKGIDAETIARQQVAGHFGLPGMRERAAIVNGQLEVRSAVGAGTEIELRVPGSTAYRASGRTSRWSRLRRMTAEPSDAAAHD
jgi:signal transduction histidine kinase/ligand-binding sensor domain-containing protein